MIDVLQQIILGLAFWFATATLIFPVISILWFFIKTLLGETETWKRTSRIQ